MRKIQIDFMRREMRRLALCAAGFAACLAVLWRCAPDSASRWPMLALGAAAVLLLAVMRFAARLRAATSGLAVFDADDLEREYAAPHPVCRVWQGELHLMPDILVCRSRGRLLLLPVHEIERVERRFDRVGLRKIPAARFVMDTDRTVRISFSPACPEEGARAFAWLAERIGEEKIV